MRTRARDARCCVVCLPPDPTTGARWVAGPIVLERLVGERLRIVTMSTTPELGRALVLGADLAHEVANAIGGAIADPVAVCVHCGARFVHLGAFWSSIRCGKRADGSIGLEHYTAAR